MVAEGTGRNGGRTGIRLNCREWQQLCTGRWQGTRQEVGRHRAGRRAGGVGNKRNTAHKAWGQGRGRNSNAGMVGKNVCVCGRLGSQKACIWGNGCCPTRAQVGHQPNGTEQGRGRKKQPSRLQRYNLPRGTWEVGETPINCPKTAAQGGGKGNKQRRVGWYEMGKNNTRKVGMGRTGDPVQQR